MKLYLKEILEQRNLSVNQLHKLTGLSRTTLDPLSKSETVPLKTRIETLEKIAAELKIPLSRMISFDETQTAKIFENLGVYHASQEFSAVEREFNDTFIINIIGPKNRTYSLLVKVKYELDDLFYEENTSLFDRIDSIVSSSSDSKISNLQLEAEFDTLSNQLENKAMEYEGKRVFNSNSFTILSLKGKKNWIEKYFPDTSVFDFTNDLSEVIADNAFIDFIASFLSDHYNLKNQVSKILPTIGDPDYFNLSEKERYTPKNVDYFPMVFMDKHENIEKLVYLDFYALD
ncbi:helix-turn-helix domain-containing protein [Enterococcus dongliensis]|uniref:XRE family transcriptional regulator n=1 Tax=Enterococcus dongliensis TaxID=2559925 RepID=A0AAW8THC3_9ENTE|nr:XRE family transcriptional regulator [Enterococcus dongliensis]MDT2636537.1 XRE family transcriptional regulator [Enterococcus dongliensis]